MFRKITLVAMPAMALIVALGTKNSASQAFAKGGSGMGKGGRNGMSRNHRGFDRFHRFDRYGWIPLRYYGYGYGYFEPVVEVPVVTPACPTCAAVGSRRDARGCGSQLLLVMGLRPVQPVPSPPRTIPPAEPRRKPWRSQVID